MSGSRDELLSEELGTSLGRSPPHDDNLICVPHIVLQALFARFFVLSAERALNLFRLILGRAFVR